MKTLVSFIALGAALAVSGPSHAGGGGKGHRDNTSLFPPKQPNKALVSSPAAPKLLEPATFAVVNGPEVSLGWQAVEGATSYHLQVATDPNFKWLKVDNANLVTTNFKFSGLEAGKFYYWRVAAFKAGNGPGYHKSPFSKSTFEVK
ncbi:MAG: fibronectin type III domain-containing protein [Bdellovibrionaceae bacterium]|nr:fibronectin type III domain-containing protein [Pseudobdellovibrionaceae bacterium]